jgi:hypothetical protein
MSVVNNIQGSLTQTQQAQQLNQQQTDQPRVAQQQGEAQNAQEQVVKKESITTQENVDLQSLHREQEKEKEKKNRKQRKKTLDQMGQQEDTNNYGTRFGGGLIDTQA